MNGKENIEYVQRMHKALLYIQRSLDEQIDPEDVAAAANFSLSHFHRVFKAMIGERLGEHIRRLRLERAALRLIYTEQSVTNIALDAAYETPESFSRAFKTMFGLPPSKYRAQLEEHIPESISGIHYQPGATMREIELELPDMASKMDVQVSHMPKIRVAFIRHTGPYAEVYKTWDQLCEWAKKAGAFTTETEFYGICYDDPLITDGQHIRYDAAMRVPDHIQAEGEVGIQEIGGREYAKYIHRGPYHKLTDTYMKLMIMWFPQSNYDIDVLPTIENYLNTPEITEEEDLLTQLFIPIRQKQRR